MSSMSSISVALSGLRAAQAGLAVTGHNVSNSTVTGYTRQQAIQQNSSYLNKGSINSGSLKLQVGLGTQVSQIRQIRNKFYDITYREENSAGNYYAIKYTAGQEINNILGELDSSYNVQDILTDIWNSINELIQDPSAIETRSLFIQSCVTFIDKMQDINNNLFSYQMNLNEQIKENVDKINSILEDIASINKQIQNVEVTGSKANDLMDTRNNLLDELSSYLDIDIKEVALPNGCGTRIDIFINGQELMVDNQPRKIGLKYVNGDYPFYEPVFTESDTVLPASSNADLLFPNLATENLGVDSTSTKGSLKALLVSRGEVIGNYSMSESETSNFLIPELQRKLDILTNQVVTLLNQAVMENNTTDLNGNAGIPIFVRISGLDYNEAVDPNDSATLYTINNITINPKLLNGDGYNKLAFSQTGDVGDTTILYQLSQAWKQPIDALGGESIDGYYKKIITDFAVQVQSDKEKLDTKLTTIDLAENSRYSLSGVSLDEELSNMLQFQHAYNAAAKIINVIDGMMDKIINGMAV